MINLISNSVTFIATSTPTVYAMGGLCAIPAIESGYRAIEDFADIIKLKKSTKSDTIERHNENTHISCQRRKLVREMTRHLAEAIILGGCALNLLPGSALVGMLGFLAYSRFSYTSEMNAKNASKSKIITGVAVRLLLLYKKKIAIKVAKYTLKITKKIIKTTKKIASVVFKAIKAALHTVKATTKAIGKYIVYPIKLFGKSIGKLGGLIAKLSSATAKAFISHPLPALGLIAGTICSITFSPLLAGISASIASIAKVALSATATGITYVPTIVAGGVKFVLSAGATAITYAPTIAVGSVKVLANVIGYVPKACSAIVSVARYILGI